MSTLINTKNLEDEICKYQQKVFDGEMDESPKDIGSINEFDTNDLLCPEFTSKIFISFGRVILTSFPTETHGNLVEIISDSTKKGLEQKFSRKIAPRGSSDINLVNLRECCSEFKKTPDNSISILYSYLDGRSDPFLVIEVSVSHESTDLLLREAEVFLNKLTQIEYAIMAKFSSVPEGSESIRIIVAQRSDSNPVFFYDSSLEKEIKEQKIINEYSLKCKGSGSKIGFSRHHEHDLKKLINEEVAKDYDIEIIFDISIDRNNIPTNITFFLDASRIVSGTSIPVPDERPVEINLEGYLIENLFLTYDHSNKKK